MSSRRPYLTRTHQLGAGSSAWLQAQGQAGVCSVALVIAGCAAPGAAGGQAGSPAIENRDVAHNVLGTYDFEDGRLLPWSSSFTPPAQGAVSVKDGAMCLSVESAGRNRWDAQLRHRAMVLRRGHSYRLGFDVWSSRPTDVTIKLGMSGAPYTDYWTQRVALTPTAAPVAGSFVMQAPDDATAELAFHAGGPLVTGAEPVEICFDRIVLSDPEFIPSTSEVKLVVPAVRVNQLGYLPGAVKQAVLVRDGLEPVPWRLLDAKGQALAQGQSIGVGRDTSSGDGVHLIDFSDFRREAEGLVLAAGDGQSDRFSINGALYRALGRDALRFFYHMRSGTPIEMPYAEQEQWAHPAGHQPDQASCAPGTECSYSLDVTGGWYDAGDQGKYVVNGGFSAWLLQNAHERALLLERASPLLDDGVANVPESGNGIPDILDEARWEVEFLLSMQVREGQPLSGLAHHKMHDVDWTALGTAPHEDEQKRVLRPPSTAATLNLAAAAAQAARLWSRFDAAFSARCLTAAERAWRAASEHPARLAPASDDRGGGAYADAEVGDEFYWAAAELFLTTGKQQYRAHLEKSPYDKAIAPELIVEGRATESAVTWQRVAALGQMSLALGGPRAPNGAARLGSTERQRYRRQLGDAAEALLVTLAVEGYRFPMAPAPHGKYPWGSNADVLGNMVLLGQAGDGAGAVRDRFEPGVVAGMDYLLGRNAMGQSYVTGFGTRPLLHPHHRFWAQQANANYPSPPPGAISGGPNSNLQDPYVRAAGLTNCPPQKCFIDHIEAYSVNEVAINWNAALTWAAIWLDEGGKEK